MDYDPVWSPDGQSIVFTSDRENSADLFPEKMDGTGLERHTDSPAYDDQAAFSPDGRQIVLVTTRAGGRPNLWTLDIATRRTKPLTSGEGGDFRPSWSPDGRWIAFSSSRGRTLTFAHGRWEHLQFADIYLIHPDGTGLKRVGDHGNFCGSPKWTADSLHIVAYCMDGEDARNARPRRCRAMTRELFYRCCEWTTTDAGGPGVKFNHGPVAERNRLHPQGQRGAGIYYTSGAGDHGGRFAPHRGHWTAPGRFSLPPGGADDLVEERLEPQQCGFELALMSILLHSAETAAGSSGGRLPAGSILGSSIAIAYARIERRRSYQDMKRNVLALYRRQRRGYHFLVGVFNAFYNGFNGLF
jgi:hypothetical protein